MLSPDCSTKAVNRALIFQNKGYETRIVMGRNHRVRNLSSNKFDSGEVSLTPYPEAQAQINGKWHWLGDYGKEIIPLDKKPKGFQPSFYFENTIEYIKHKYGKED